MTKEERQTIHQFLLDQDKRVKGLLESGFHNLPFPLEFAHLVIEWLDRVVLASDD